MSILEQIHDNKIIAVIRLDDLSDAVELTRALIAGGVKSIEFTLTNLDAIETIATVKRAVGDGAVIGAGSVMTVEQVEAVVDSGAEFVVSPVTKAPVIEACYKHNVLIMPGAFTPTEIQNAWEMGASAIKLFPANIGGARYVKDLLAPLPHLKLITTGGINRDNVKEFFDAGVFAVGVGGSLFNKADLHTQNWSAITESARAMCEAIQ